MKFPSTALLALAAWQAATTSAFVPRASPSFAVSNKIATSSRQQRQRIAKTSTSLRDAETYEFTVRVDLKLLQ